MPAATAAATTAASAPAATFQAPEATALLYRGVAIRFVAILIDVIILAIITGIITAPFNTPSSISVTNATGVPMVSVSPNPLAWVGGLISALVDFLYFVLLQGAYGQTVGKMAGENQGGSRGRFKDQLC